MCLYPVRILNKRFLPNRKNGYQPPICHDERLRYVMCECGKCFECRKKKAREWRIRMSEELKENPSAIFFTGTLADERIEKLCKKYNIKKTDYNQIATKEVRLFLERIRRFNGGKSIKHWIVTERGHTNTRRIHIHGIFYHHDKKKLSQLLKNEWIAGYSYQGNYVNEKTINYISKYMTKTDLDNPTFRGIVLASPGLGREYINRLDGRKKYIPRTETQQTDECYRFRNGAKSALPKYYKYKIFSEEERELLWIEKQESGEKYVMGEKIICKTAEEEDKYYSPLVVYYRNMCQKLHGDNPEQWRIQKMIYRKIQENRRDEKLKKLREKEYRAECRMRKKLDEDLYQFQQIYNSESIGGRT